MFLYKLLRPIVGISLNVFFKKVYFTNQENIPNGKPIIFAANHPTAFLEPILLACWLDVPLHFLVRGDFFKKPFFRRLLFSINTLPVYRKHDAGYSKIKNNYSTFSICYDTLGKNRPVMILVEGRTLHEKRLRPIQKGAARISFGTLESKPHVDEVYIVPVGVNYSYADKARKEAMIDFGKPILAKKYHEIYKENQTAGITQLTGEITKRLEERVIIIANEDDDDLAEQLFVLYRNDNLDYVLPITSSDSNRLFTEKSIADTINKLDDDKNKTVKSKTNEYFNKLKENNITDFGVANPGYFNFFSTFVLALGFIPFLIGVITNFLPVFGGSFIKKNFVHDRTFKSSVFLASTIGMWLFYMAILLIWGIVHGNIYTLLFILIIPFLGYFSMVYFEFYEKWNAAKMFKKHSADDALDLLDDREKLLTFLRKTGFEAF